MSQFSEKAMEKIKKEKIYAHQFVEMWKKINRGMLKHIMIGCSVTVSLISLLLVS